jgi:hypothetical protein
MSSSSTAEMLNQTFASDPDGFASMIGNVLNATYSPLIQLYKCGDIDAITDSLSLETNNELGALLLTERNKQMAEKVAEVLKGTDPDKKILFAVGLAHWLSGSDNMISLLEDYGYSMEHVPYWNGTQAENPSNEFCGVQYNPEAGIFVQDSSPTPSGEEKSSTTPTAMPSQGAEKEVVPEPVASAICTMTGIITMMIVWCSYIMMYIC